MDKFFDNKNIIIFLVIIFIIFLLFNKSKEYFVSTNDVQNSISSTEARQNLLINNAENALASLQPQIAGYNNQLSQLDLNNSNIQGKINTLVSNISILNNNLINLMGNIRNLENYASRNARQVATTNNKYIKLNSQVPK